MGTLDPDAIVLAGIKALQQKLAAIIAEVGGGVQVHRGDEYEPSSPTIHGASVGNGYAMDVGYTTPFDSGGGPAAWGGGGGTTPFGATPYGEQPREQAMSWGGGLDSD